MAALGACWSRRATWGRHALLGGGWFLLNLVPILGVVPLSYLRVAPRADHFVYLSLVGVTALAGAIFAAIWDARPNSSSVRRVVLALTVGAVVVVLAFLSRTHATVFRDEASLWREAVVRSPDAWLAHNNLGKVLMGVGSPQLAREQFEAALRLGPDSAEVHTNLANALEEMNLVSAAQEHYNAAVKIAPAFAGAHYGLGRLLLRTRQPEALAELQRAHCTRCPTTRPPITISAWLWAQVGQPARAISEYQQALRLDPRLPEAYLNLGNAEFRAGQVEDAVQQYRKALQINPAIRRMRMGILAAALHQRSGATQRRGPSDGSGTGN